MGSGYQPHSYSPRHHHIERFGEAWTLDHEFLGSPFQDYQVLEIEFPLESGQEGHVLAPGFNKSERNLRTDDPNRHSRDTGSRAEIHHGQGAIWKLREEQQRVQKQLSNNDIG